MNIGIDLDQAIHALADALDLVGVDEMKCSTVSAWV